MPRDNFSKLPLVGIIFYLDVPKYIHNKQLESRLVALGATIEPFLTKNITYFVTDSDLEHMSSTTHQLPVVKSSSHPILLSNKVQTRAQKILSKITPNPKEAAVQRAQKMNLNIQPLNKVLRWLTDIEKRRTIYSGPKSHDLLPVKSSPLREFFIKVEDKSRFFRPLYKQFLSMPSINYNTSLQESPFQKNQVRTRAANKRLLLKSRTSSFDKRSKSSLGSKGGYCEICSIYFTNRRQHLQGDCHKRNTTPTKFKRLDQIIAKRSSYEKFLSKLKQNATTSRSVNPEISLKSISPFKLLFSRSHAIKRKTKKSLSCKSSFESVNASNFVKVENGNKRIKLGETTFVSVNSLKLKIKKTMRLQPVNLGSKKIPFPVYESSKENIATLTTTLWKQRDRNTRRSRVMISASPCVGQLRRSQRLIAKQKGLQYLKCPLLVRELAN